MAVAESEVGGVDRQREALVLDADARVRDGEVARGMLRDGYRLDGVALTLAGCRLERFVELHVGVQGVILGTDVLLRIGIVEGGRHLGLLREELAKLEVGGHGVALLRVGGALHDALLKPSEAVGDVAAGQVDRSEVAQLHVHGAAGGPSALVDGVLESELVDPHLARLKRIG